MVIDRQRALAAFQKYTGNYDITDEKVKLKIDHTYRVCALCEQIAAQSGFDEDEIRLSWLTGLLHDVGRFEQALRHIYRRAVHRPRGVWCGHTVQARKDQGLCGGRVRG